MPRAFAERRFKATPSLPCDQGGSRWQRLASGFRLFMGFRGLDGTVVLPLVAPSFFQDLSIDHLPVIVELDPAGLAAPARQAVGTR